MSLPCCMPLSGAKRVDFSLLQPCSSRLPHSFTPAYSTAAMPHITAEAKHHILLEYQPRSTTHSFAALARKHNIAGGESTVRRWHQRWNGSAASLQEKKRSGRPRLLSRAQVSRYVRAPILAANRAHRAIHYSTLLPSVQAKSHTQVSLRSLQRYGQQELGVKQKHSKKRTADESECTDTREMERACV
jgi:transposase